MSRNMLCRLCCLNEPGQDTLQDYIIQLIAKNFHMEVSQSDVICSDCSKRLNDFQEFCLYVEQRQRLLQNEFFQVNCVMSEEMTMESKNDQGKNLMESLLDIKDMVVEDNCFDEFAMANETHQDNNRNVSNKEEIKSLDDKGGNENKTYLKRKKKMNSKGETKTSRHKYLCRSNRKKMTKNIETLFSLEGNDEGVEKLSTNSAATIVVESSRFVNKPKKLNSSKENGEKNDMIAEYMQLKCDICQEKANNMAALRLHFRNVHNRKAYVTCCGRRFHRRFLLVDHIRVHLNPECFKCNICNKIFKSRINLENHNANVHTEKSELRYPCTKCDRRFAHSTNLMAHMLSHAKERNFRCEHCNKAFKSSMVLKKHISSIHESVTPANICDTCGKEYKSKQSFDRHVAEHQGNLKSPLKKQCKICQKWFSTAYFSRHEKLHDFENVNCEKCGKSFRSNASLNYHLVNTHEGKRNYFCTICDKKFLRPEYLKEHINRHTGEKMYSCSYCSCDFRSKSSMYVHVKKAHFEQWKQAKMTKNIDVCESESPNIPKDDFERDGS